MPPSAWQPGWPKRKLGRRPAARDSDNSILVDVEVLAEAVYRNAPDAMTLGSQAPCAAHETARAQRAASTRAPAFVDEVDDEVVLPRLD